MTPYLLTHDKTKCSCCGSCVQVCPVNAITRENDSMGFPYPKLNSAVCISCGKCARACHYNDDNKKTVRNEEYTAFYAGRNKSESVLQSCASGGAFDAISRVILKKSGCVFGAKWTKDFSAVNSIAQNYSELHQLYGSKYVFCELSHSFDLVKQKLSEKMPVLFSGTPCQVAALYSFLGHDDENLYTADIICHGVPSQKYLNIFIAELQKKYHSKVKSINFKDKEYSWRSPTLRVQFENGTEYKKPIWSSSYGQLFHNRITVMSACNACEYAALPRKSDITIGDFWNYDNKKYKLGDEKNGISTIIVNSSKGNRLLNEAEIYLDLISAHKEDAMQLHLQQSAEPANPVFQEEVLRAIETFSMEEAIQSVNDPNLKQRILRRLFRM